MKDYRQVGFLLGRYLQENELSQQQVQAILGDILPGDEILIPIRDAASRNSFQHIQARAGSGEGIIYRDSLLSELSRTYVASVVDRIAEIVNGILDLPTTSTYQPEGANKYERYPRSEASNEQYSQDSFRRLSPSDICDENLWNRTRDPQSDKRFLKAWTLRWFNKKYRPRLFTKEQE